MPSPPLRAAVAVLFCTAAFAACLLDQDNQCGRDQVFEKGYCVCAEGLVPKGQDECVPCPADERAEAGQCVCTGDNVRPMPGAACAPRPTPGLGVACSSSMPCTIAPFTHCQPTTDSEGYCTMADCSDTRPCMGGWACDRTAMPAYCKRPPRGLGMACTTASQCAGTEATYCEAVQLKRCIVEGCNAAASNCYPGYLCCDLAKLGLAKTLCLPTPSCP